MKIFRYFPGWFNELIVRKQLTGKQTDLSVGEFEVIVRCLEKFDSPVYAEIGVYFGGNLLKILDYLSRNKDDYFVYGADLFEGLLDEVTDSGEQVHDKYNKWGILNVAYKEDLRRQLKSLGFARFELLKGSSDVVISRLNVNVDVAFIDGNHTYNQAMKDARACLSKMKLGSYLVMHNASKDLKPDSEYYEADGGPWKACSDLAQEGVVERVDQSDRSVVLKVLSS